MASISKPTMNLRTVAERTEELFSLSTYLQSSMEREKGRLARDLHDELGGILTAAKIDASWLEGFAAAAGPEVLQRMKRLSGSLDEAVEVKRRGAVRASKLYYLRGLEGKKARIKEDLAGNAKARAKAAAEAAAE